MKVQGLNKVLKNLNDEIQKIENRTAKGLYRAAIPIRRDAQKNCPVITTNLKASAYIITSWSGVVKGESPSFSGENSNEMAADHKSTISKESVSVKGSKYPVVQVGFTAVYAASVHENPQAGRNNPRSGERTKGGRLKYSEVGEWKFLEKAVKTHADNAIKVIAEEARIK